MLLYSKKGIIWLSNFVFLTLNVDENDIINLIGGITRSYYTLAVTSDASLCHSESPDEQIVLAEMGTVQCFAYSVIGPNCKEL